MNAIRRALSWSPEHGKDGPGRMQMDNAMNDARETGRCNLRRCDETRHESSVTSDGGRRGRAAVASESEPLAPRSSLARCGCGMKANQRGRGPGLPRPFTFTLLRSPLSTAVFVFVFRLASQVLSTARCPPAVHG